MPGKLVNILITYKSKDPYTQHRLEDVFIHQIDAIDDKVRTAVVDLSEVDEEAPLPVRQQFDEILEETDIIFGHRLPRRVLSRAPKLKWFQAMSAGVDMFLSEEFKNSGVILTNMRGISALPIAESVIGMILTVTKKMELCYELKRKRQWKQFHPGLLNGKTIGIIGLGNIGKEVARLASCFGMKVIAADYMAKPGDRRKNVEQVYTPDKIENILSESDFIVLTAPLTPQTHNLINAERLGLMKSTACLINVSRGPIVDEAALITALKEKIIAAAALDVFNQEPLPEDSPLWDLPNLTICPHVSGYVEDQNRRATEIFCTNLRRYLDGKKLHNLVDKKLGF
jgi:D-2-hydroxyacid dehydrogenase (NADP+)